MDWLDFIKSSAVRYVAVYSNGHMAVGWPLELDLAKSSRARFPEIELMAVGARFRQIELTTTYYSAAVPGPRQPEIHAALYATGFRAQEPAPEPATNQSPLTFYTYFSLRKWCLPALAAPHAGDIWERGTL